MDIGDKVQTFDQAQLSRQLRGLCHYLDDEDLEDSGDDGEDETDKALNQQTCHLACSHICEWIRPNGPNISWKKSILEVHFEMC